MHLLLEILLHSFAAHFLALVNDGLGIEDGCLVSKADDPAQEHRGYCYLYSKGKMVLSVRDQHNFFAKAVNGYIQQFLVEP